MDGDILQPQSMPSKRQDLGRYWKQILANIPDAVTVYDTAGKIVYANELASQDLRYSSVDQLMKENLAGILDRYNITDTDDKPIPLEELPTRRAVRDRVPSQATIHCRDGQEDFWLVAKAFPIINRAHNIKFVVSTYHEITPYKQAEAQLRESNRRMLEILNKLMKMD